MAKNLTTHRFKLHHVRQFIESVNERANTEYYVFAGHPIDYENPDAIPVTIDCVQSLHQRVYDEMTHAKRVTPNDLYPMIRKIIWTSGTVYDQYESDISIETEQLSNKNFYVVNQSGSENNYYVFKCLYNNNGAQSISPPKRSEVEPEDPYYETSDGYIWKYMYEINPSAYRKFATDQYIPVIPDTAVSANAVPGEIDVIQVNYAGSLYNNYFLGQIYPGDSSYNGVAANLRLNLPEQDRSDIVSIDGDGTTVTVTTDGNHNYTNDMKIQISGAVSISPVSINYDGIYTITVLGPTQFQFDDPSALDRDEINIGKAFIYNPNAPTVSYADQYYKNCVIKIISGPARGQYRRILSYDGDFRVATLADFNSDTPYPFSASQSDLQYALYQIYPQAIIKGDDREESTAVAWAVIDSATANSVSRVEVLDKGKGHFLATANVYAEPNVVRISNSITEATVRPILPPPGGHGKDPAAELYADRVGISVKFSNNENGQISTDNDFNIVGLIKDPLWNKIKINYNSDDLAGSFIDAEEVAILDQTYLSGSAYVYTDSKQIQAKGDFGGVTFAYITDPDLQTTNLVYSNNDVVTVSNENPFFGGGQYIPALCDIVTYANGHIQGASVKVTGWGFSNTNVGVKVANSIGGFIRHMGNTGIYEYDINASGKAYENNEIITVTTTTGNYSAATAQITTDSLGAITSINILDTGKGYNKNGISYISVDPLGTAYVNNVSTVIGPPAPQYNGIDAGTTATLSVTTDNVGNLASIQYTSTAGTGYPVIPGQASIIGDGSTVTVNTYTLHGFSINDKVVISGTVDYNGTHTITGVGVDGYTFTYSSSVNQGEQFGFVNLQLQIASIEPYASLGDECVKVNIANHNLLIGTNIKIQGTSNYNGDFTVFNVLDNDNFTYIDNKTAVPPETVGTLTFAPVSFQPFSVLINTIQGNTGTPETINSIAGDGTEVTVTTSTNHKFVIDENVIISGTTNYNGGPFTIIEVPDLTTFKYSDSTQGANSSGTATGLNSANLEISTSTDITSGIAAGHTVKVVGNYTSEDYEDTWTVKNVNFDNNIIQLNYRDEVAYFGACTTPASTGAITGFSPNTSLTMLYIQSNDSDFNVFKTNGTESYGAKVTDISVESSGNLVYQADDIIYVTSTSDTPSGDAQANTVVDGSNLLVDISLNNNGGNYGFTLSGEETPYVTNSTSGFIRWFNSTGIVSGYTINNALPNSAINTVSVTGTMTNYDSTAIQGVNIISGGKGYNSQSNNLIQFVSVTGASAAATFTNNAVGTITNITITNSGTNYLTDFSTLKVIPFVEEHPNGVGAVLEAYLANTLIVTPHANDTDTASGAVVRFTSTGGAITAVNVVDGGFGYRYPPTFSVPSGVGAGAIFTPTLKSDTDVFSNNDKVISVAYGDEAINSSANITVSSNYINIIDIENSGTPFYTTALPFTYIEDSNTKRRYIDQSSPPSWKSMVKSITFSDNTQMFAATDVLKIYGQYNFESGIGVDGSGNITGLFSPITNYGYSIPDEDELIIEVMNSGGTNIRRLNSTIVNTIDINDGGAGFNNNHVLVIDSGTNTSNALFRVVTDDTYGTIKSFSAITRGANQKPAYVESIRLVNGGGGYANTILVNGTTGDYLDFCGGGTNANGHIVTDNNGVIQAIYLTDGGINYNCKPEVRIIDSSSGNPRTTVYGGGSFSQASIEATINKPHRIRIYTDDTLSKPAFSSQFIVDLDINMIESASANVTLAYTPQITTNINVPATINVTKDHSANILFQAQTSPVPTVTIQPNLTSYTEVLDSGDLVYLYTLKPFFGNYTPKADLLEVDNVINSTTFTVKDFPNFSGYAGVARVRKQANGTVYEETSGSSITLENVKGTLGIANTIFGIDSRASTVIGSTEFNNIQKTNINVNQLFMYKGAITGTFQEDELIYADDALTGGSATAYVHSVDSNKLYITSPTGQFNVNATYIGQLSGAQIVINDGPNHKYEGDIVRGSGDVMYVQAIDPISRANNQSETIKLLLEF